MSRSQTDDATLDERLALLNMPKHVAIIMDGNGRWAKKKGKIRTFGHRAGVESVRAAVRFARKNAIQSLTLFAFSSENWKRPEEEVSVLMDLFNLVLNSEAKRLNKNGVRLKVLGDTSRFDRKLVDKINKAEAMTADNKELVLNIAANYGGRWDIVNAARQLADKVSDGSLNANQIDEAVFDQHMSTQGLPELDLLIRTGGEHRISNFLLWQCAYAELYFTDVLWPDFDEEAFYLAVKDYSDDPVKNPEAKLYSQLSYQDVLEKELKVMDLSAFTLARDHSLPIRVYNMNKPGCLKRVVMGEPEGTLIDHVESVTE